MQDPAPSWYLPPQRLQDVSTSVNLANKRTENAAKGASVGTLLIEFQGPLRYMTKSKTTRDNLVLLPPPSAARKRCRSRAGQFKCSLPFDSNIKLKQVKKP